MTENSAGEWHFDFSAVQIGSRLPLPVQHYLTYGHREFFSPYRKSQLSVKSLTLSVGRMIFGKILLLQSLEWLPTFTDRGCSLFKLCPPAYHLS